jgi:hypothetical protein
MKMPKAANSRIMPLLGGLAAVGTAAASCASPVRSMPLAAPSYPSSRSGSSALAAPGEPIDPRPASAAPKAGSEDETATPPSDDPWTAQPPSVGSDQGDVRQEGDWSDDGASTGDDDAVDTDGETDDGLDDESYPDDSGDGY